jgi:DNA polymerase I-like protein with 3'-5' exonuclease and polymerase domains
MSYGAGPTKIASQLKISKVAATVIFNNYWKLYKEIKQFNEGLLKTASMAGYTVSKFSGLRLLTPNLKSSDPKIVAKETRVIGNFAIQSGNILTLLRAIEFQKWVEDNNLTNRVRVFNSIHDAVYLYVDNDPELLSLVNKSIVQFLTRDYKTSQAIPLEAELDIGFNWKHQITLSNSATPKDIADKIQTAYENYQEVMLYV